ncbi:MAG: hypothetical protein NVS9B15_06060 [Acidobacteriaceae bacterium]
MSELDELKESAEHAMHNPSLVPVSFTMALLAVLVAIATLLGHRAHTEELLLQTRASDTWAEYQAKNIRANMHELLIANLEVVAPANDRTEKLKKDWETRAAKLNGDKGPLQEEARKLETESHVEQHRGDRFDLSEALLEMALVVTSITLLTRNRLFWFAGLVLGLIGFVIVVPVLR